MFTKLACAFLSHNNEGFINQLKKHQLEILKRKQMWTEENAQQVLDAQPDK